MSGFPLPLLGFIWWFSLVSCSINGLPYRVPNRPWFGKYATEGDSYAFFHVLASKLRARERAISLQYHYPYPWVTGGHGKSSPSLLLGCAFRILSCWYWAGCS